MRTLLASGLLLATVFFSGCATGGDPRAAARMKNQRAPDFELPAVDGSPVRLSSFRGKPVVLAFWAIGCPPCCAEAPHLSRLSEQHAKDGLVVLGVNAWNEPKVDVERYVKENRLKHRILLEGNALFLSYGFEHIPTVLLIRPDGTVAEVEQGFNGPQQLEENVKRLIDG